MGNNHEQYKEMRKEKKDQIVKSIKFDRSLTKERLTREDMDDGCPNKINIVVFKDEGKINERLRIETVKNVTRKEINLFLFDLDELIVKLRIGKYDKEPEEKDFCFEDYLNPL